MFEKVFDIIEVISKKISKQIDILISKAKMYLDQERKKYFLDTTKFILFYGVLVNLAVSLIFQIQFNLFNIIASGAIYYLLVDLLELLASLDFILFKRGEKKWLL